MKLSELKPCTCCGGPLPVAFYVLRFHLAGFDAHATREVVGLANFFHGALGLAEAMAPRSDVVKVCDDYLEAFVCMNCITLGDLRLAEVMERAISQAKETDQPTDDEPETSRGIRPLTEA